VKRDPGRFPRAADQYGVPQEILSPFSRTNRDADTRAFAAMQKHLRETDGTRHTVVMVQVENEIGMIPTARDHSPEADRAFASAVPAELMGEYILRAAFERGGGPALADGVVAGDGPTGPPPPSGGLVLATAPDDETHQGRHIRLPPGRFSLQRVRLYAY
jgi:hypothetical protein